MKKTFKRILAAILTVVMVMAAVPLSGIADLSIIPGTFLNAFASNDCYVNASYSRVTCNADDGSMPTGVKTFYYGEDVYINLQCGSNIYIRNATYHLSKNGISDYATDTIYPQNDYIRYCYAGWDYLSAGSYSVYWTITYSAPDYSSSITTYTTSSYSFSVVDRTPALNTSSSSVSLDLSGTTSKTITVWKSCDLSYSCTYHWDKNSSAFSCDWGDWTSDNKLPLTITANSPCTNEPLIISLLRSSDDSVVTSKTIYVTITRPSYTVSYNANGGSGAPSSQTKYYNEALKLSTTVPTRACYNFSGWGTSSTSTSASYQPGGSYTSNSGRTLYAVWSQNAISSGTSVSTSINRAGQIYWYKFTPSSSGTYVMYSTGSDDTYGYLYNSSGSQITYDDDAGDGNNFRLEYNLTGGTTYCYGVKYLNSSKTGSIPVKFGPVYTISYNANGGTGAPPSQKKDWGKDLTLSSTKPTRTGYTFLGWSTSSSAASATYQPGGTFSSDGNYTLYAVWSGGDTTKPTGSISSTNNVASSQTVTLSLLDNAGVAGYYWGTSSTYSNNTYTATSSSSITKTISSAGTYYLTVKDTSGNVSSNYSITFYKTTLNANGGSVTPSYVITKSGNSFTLPTPTYTGRTFKNWNTSSSGTGTAYTGSYTVSTDRTLYAQYDMIDSTKPTGSISSSNNVESSQTVTLSLSDNVKVAGYYWGTSSTYSNNTYTATSSSSVKKTISSSGTYYLTVKDTSGNVSSNYSITFYKTTLDANGGSVSPASVLTKSGNSFTFPTPTGKSGYTYSGWSTSKTATSGVKSLTPTSNATYYAVWEKNTSEFTQKNRYSFSNSHYSFFGHNEVDKDEDCWCDICHNAYPMTDSDKEKLYNYIRKYEFNPEANISDVQYLMNESWGGSCFGMAATAVLDYQNKIAFNENFGTNAATMWDVESPSKNINVMSAINYYYVSQWIDSIFNGNNTYFSYESNWNAGLRELVKFAQKGEPFLFCFYAPIGAHAIVALDCTTGKDGNYYIRAYDNNYPNEDVNIIVSSDFERCYVDVYYDLYEYYYGYGEDAECFGISFYKDMSVFDIIDIDGPNNDMNIVFNNSKVNNNNAVIIVDASDDITVSNKAGETITCRNGKISGTMEVISKHFIVCDSIDGTLGSVKLILEVAPSKSFTFESTSENMDVSVKSNGMFAAAASEDADYIVVGDNEGIYVVGDNIKYSAALSSKESGYDTVILEGAAKRDVSLKYSENNILINGVNGKDETITIYAHDEMNPKDYEIKEGYAQVKVVTENNNIDIKGSSKNDGKFDISVIKKDGAASVSINDIVMNYKSAAKIVPTISSDDGAKYTVKYESSNPSVATVDKDGNITTFGKGETKINCTVTDEAGNVVKDTCTVTVKFQWWQWLIWILLLGFLWY